jgi:hypothetical protein
MSWNVHISINRPSESLCTKPCIVHALISLNWKGTMALLYSDRRYICMASHMNPLICHERPIGIVKHGITAVQLKSGKFWISYWIILGLWKLFNVIMCIHVFWDFVFSLIRSWGEFTCIFPLGSSCVLVCIRLTCTYVGLHVLWILFWLTTSWSGFTH